MAIASKLYLSEGELLERWGMADRDRDKNNRYLRHLREKRLLPFVRLSKTHFLYPLADIERFEQDRLVSAQEVLDDTAPEDIVPRPRKRGRPKKGEV